MKTLETTTLFLTALLYDLGAAISENRLGFSLITALLLVPAPFSYCLPIFEHWPTFNYFVYLFICVLLAGFLTVLLICLSPLIILIGGVLDYCVTGISDYFRRTWQESAKS